MGFFMSWALSALGLWIATKVVPGFEIKGDWKSFVLVAAIVGVIGFFLSWLIFGVLIVGTLGLGLLFKFVISIITSAIVLKIADAVSERFTIHGFVPALWGALVLAATNSVADLVIRH